MNRFQTKYIKEVAPVLKQEFGYGNVHQIPKITKVVINIGVGRAAADQKFLDVAIETTRKITGQQPVATKARQSIAGFKLREGNKVGIMVTLRGERMYAFLDRLVSVTLPRIRDFRGISATAFDPQGNYNLGLTDQTIFPELTYEEAASVSGLQVNIVSTATNVQAGRRLMQLMGFPLRKDK